jgi:two-component system, LytTR family, response regulator
MKAIIIDDELDCVSVLAKMLSRHCPQVQIVFTTSNSTEGLAAIRSEAPDLLFLDIEMPVLNGFQLLDELDEIPFQLVFTTAYDSYAVRAIKYSALDYLLKPIDATELIAAVSKSEQRTKIDRRQLDILQRQANTAGQNFMSDKIALPYQHGYTFIELGQIISCESDGSYTKVALVNGENYLITKTLGDVEEILTGRQLFFRVHRQFLINMNCIKRFIRTDGAYLVMQNDQNVPIARNRKEEFVQLFLHL